MAFLAIYSTLWESK